MARQGSVSFGASRRPLYDAVVGALFVLICAASVYLPILLLPGAIVLCALLRGGRTTYPALLFALGFAAIVLVLSLIHISRSTRSFLCRRRCASRFPSCRLPRRCRRFGAFAGFC